MYEQNLKPLATGDASEIFAEQLAEIRRQGARPLTSEVTPDTVVRMADDENLSQFLAICRRLLLPGSRVQGLSHLQQLVDLADRGEACLLCLNHRSNLDAGTLNTLLKDVGKDSLFKRIIWIAGRKLEEDPGMTGLLVQGFNRIIVSPHGWFASHHDVEETQRARQVNLAAERAIARMRRQGWVLALFPTGTRIREDDETTKQAIAQTYSYLRMFDHLLLCHIDGCTLPVSKDSDMMHERPKLDRVVYAFSSVYSTKEWLSDAAARFPNLDKRSAAARAMTEDIETLR